MDKPIPGILDGLFRIGWVHTTASPAGGKCRGDRTVVTFS